MKINARFWLVLSMIGILSCVVLPSVNAETYDIGEKLDSDLTNASSVYHPFSSGAIVRADDFEVNLTSLIFDGNLSTGIETNYSQGDLDWGVFFPHPIYVNNITIKPNFGNGSSNFTLIVFVIDTTDYGVYLGWEANGERVYQMNCFISVIDLTIHPNGTDQFYFNDVIIDYNPGFPHLDELQNQINILTEQLNSLNNMINELNNSINALNLTQEEIENVTNLLTTYNELNESFTNFIGEIQNLDNRILQLESVNAALKNEVENLTSEIENLKDEDKQLDEPMVYFPFIFGILSIIIALIAIILASKKMGGQEPPTETKASRDSQMPPTGKEESMDSQAEQPAQQPVQPPPRQPLPPPPSPPI